MAQSLERREVLKTTAAAMMGALGPLRGDAKPVRIGVIGLGPRGQWLLENLVANDAAVAIPAVCDPLAERAAQASALVSKYRKAAPAVYTRGAKDYLRLLENPAVDAVIVATPVNLLAPLTIDALKAGKHAAFEVSGIQTEEHCWQMVEAKQKSGKHVMFLENCCYGQDNLMVYRLLREGVMGEPYYAEGSYVHDCRSLFFDDSGKITWRGELQRDVPGSAYPQHGLGSACKWLEINDGDRMVSCQTMMAAPREVRLWGARKYGASSEAATTNYREGDFVSSLISTAKGRMLRLDYSICCTRPYSRYYVLQGTNGSWDSRSGLYLPSENQGKGEAWAPASAYRARFEHSYWRERGDIATRNGGHGGIDYFVTAEFVRMLREDREPWIDVYDAASWSSLIFCSKLSLDRNGARVAMPDFTNGQWKSATWRAGRIPAA